MQDLPHGGGGRPEPRRRQPCRPMRQGGGGGGCRCKHWPPGAGDPRYAIVTKCNHVEAGVDGGCGRIGLWHPPAVLWRRRLGRTG